MSSAAVFTIMKLPFLAQLEVLSNLEFDDLLNFSTISPEACSLAKCLQQKLDNLTWKFDEANRHTIKLDDEDFVIVINPNFASWKPNATLHVITLGGLDIKVCQMDKCWVIAEPNRPNAFYLDVMDRFTKAILTICNVGKFNLETIPRMDVIDLLVWKHTRSLEYFHFPTNRYSGPELTFVLQKVTVKNLILPEDFPDSKYTGPLTMEKLDLGSGSWLTEDLLKTMKCKEVDIQRNFTLPQCNVLIKLWLQGLLPDLENFTVDAWILDIPEMVDVILDGVETMPWNPKNRSSHGKDIDLSQGRDVRRADGKVATISTRANFMFCVWQ